jgi:AcrR family transcriptional regulator
LRARAAHPSHPTVRIDPDPQATRSALSGRRGQAARNDELILQAARKVFLTDAEAPIGAVATRAGVGASALYRCYASKDDLLRTLCQDGLRLFIEGTRAALEDDRDPRAAFSDYVRTQRASRQHTVAPAH